MKRCRKCKRDKPLESFTRASRSKDGRHSYCLDCLREYCKQWLKRNPARASNFHRNSAYKRRYGITLDEYEDLATTQKGRCAICGCVPARLFVDHNHITNSVRGLLCNECNFLLGHAKEDERILKQAIKYLRIYALTK